MDGILGERGLIENAVFMFLLRSFCCEEYQSKLKLNLLSRKFGVSSINIDESLKMTKLAIW